MNFAFQALVILAFLAPGMIFRTRYNRGRWNYPLGRLGTITEQLPKAIIYSAMLNFLWCLLIELLIAILPRAFPKIDYNAAVYWLSNSVVRDKDLFVSAREALTSHPQFILCYFVGLYSFAFVAGIVAHYGVRLLHLDLLSFGGVDKVLRYDNDWHYIFTGEILDFGDERYRSRPGMLRPDMSAKDQKATAIAAMVDGKDGSILYVGILVDFFFDSAGNLDRLLLTGVRRRALNPDEKLDNAPLAGVDGKEANDAMSSPASILSSYLQVERFYPVSGHFFVLRMSEVKTLNIDYLTAEEVEAAHTLRKKAIVWLGRRYEKAKQESQQQSKQAPESGTIAGG